MPGLFEVADHGGFVYEEGGEGLTADGVGVEIEGPHGELAAGGELEPVFGFAFGLDEGGEGGFEGTPLGLEHFVGGGEIGSGGSELEESVGEIVGGEGGFAKAAPGSEEFVGSGMGEDLGLGGMRGGKVEIGVGGARWVARGFGHGVGVLSYLVCLVWNVFSAWSRMMWMVLMISWLTGGRAI